MWFVRIIPEADNDLPLLKRQDRKAFQQAEAYINELETDPYIGAPCEREPLVGDGRKKAFGNQAQYRLIWRVTAYENQDAEYEGLVEVLIVGYKAGDSSFYEEAAKRWGQSRGHPDSS